jgi:hypothetical protein
VERSKKFVKQRGDNCEIRLERTVQLSEAGEGIGMIENNRNSRVVRKGAI